MNDFFDDEKRAGGDLGKLKRILKERCSECGSHLQLRSREIESMIRGEEITTWEDYVVCPDCGCEEEVKEKRNRRRPKGEDAFGY